MTSGFALRLSDCPMIDWPIRCIGSVYKLRVKASKSAISEASGSHRIPLSPETL